MSNITHGPRNARELGLPLVPSAKKVLQLPAGSFPYGTMSKFGMLNVAGSNLSGIVHYDQDTFAYLGTTAIGGPPTNNVASIDWVGSLIVAGDQAAGCLWFVDPVTMTKSGPALSLGASVRDIVCNASYVYAFSDTGGWVKEIDPIARTVLRTASVPYVAHGCWDGFNRIWIATTTNNQVVEFDIPTMTVVRTFGVGPVGVNPISVDLDADYAWIGNNGSSVINPGTTPGSISKIDRDTGAVTTFNMGTGNALHFIRRAPGSNLLLCTDANANGIIVFDTEFGKVVRWIDTGPNTIGMDISHDGQHFIATCGNNDTVEIRPLETLL